MWLSGVQKELYARFSSDAVVTTDIRFIQDYLNVCTWESRRPPVGVSLLFDRLVVACRLQGRENCRCRGKAARTVCV
jgi:hypothetical protein